MGEVGPPFFQSLDRIVCILNLKANIDPYYIRGENRCFAHTTDKNSDRSIIFGWLTLLRDKIIWYTERYFDGYSKKSSAVEIGMSFFDNSITYHAVITTK